MSDIVQPTRSVSDGEQLPSEPSGWLTIPEVADQFDIRITAVHRMIRDGSLLALRRNGVLNVPSELVTRDEKIAKHLAGVITVLRDAGLSDESALRWLYTPDDTLPGTPAAALHGQRAREVKRRAQALA